MNPSRTPPAPSRDLAAQTETPNRLRQSSSSQYRASEARSVVVEDLGDVPLVSIDFFASKVLPPIGNTILEKIRASLIKKKHFTKKNSWSSFPQSPNPSGKNKTRAFSAFPTMIQHIVQAASPFMCSEPALEFVYKPNATRPVSERNNASRPDGQLELKAKKSLGALASSSRLCSESLTSRWEDIVLPCEFKLDENDYEDVCSLRVSYRYIIHIRFY